MSRAASRAAFLVLLALAIGSLVAPVAASSKSRTKPVYWGAWVGNQYTGAEAPWDMNAVLQFEQTVGKPVSMIHFASPFANCSLWPRCLFYPFPTDELGKVRHQGAIPVLSWSSQSVPSQLDQSEFQLADVAEGKFDDYILYFANAAKAWGSPFFLRFNWEMNGDWFPWAERANGNRRGDYVAAWRHVHDIFATAGAKNVSWIWCPNVDPDGTLQGVASLYPGDAYVDWTCLDGYNWGTNPGASGPGSSLRGWKSFHRLFHSTYRKIVKRIAPTKPMIVGEVASSEYGGSKARWIRNMFRRLPSRYPRIRALLWFEKYDSSMDWPVGTSQAAVRAFSIGIGRRAYPRDAYAGIRSSPIRPPH